MAKKINVGEMSLEDLKALQREVNKAIDTYEDRRRKEALAVVEAKAKEMGFSMNDLYGPGKKGSAPRPAKFRHPENPDLTWSGRGRQPQWFKDALENGTNPDDLLIAS